MRFVDGIDMPVEPVVRRLRGPAYQRSGQQQPACSRGKRQRPYLDLLPLIQRVADAFGPDRLMWETDSGGPTIPDDPAASFKASVELIRDHADFLSDSDKAQILYKTAEDFFFNR